MTVDYSRQRMTRGEPVRLPPVAMPPNDKSLRVEWDIDPALLRDPSCETRLELWASPDNGQTWRFGGSASVVGSADRRADMPSMRHPAPPAGWLVEVRMFSEKDNIQCGCRLASVAAAVNPIRGDAVGGTR